MSASVWNNTNVIEDQNLISCSSKILLRLCRNGQYSPEKQWHMPVESLSLGVRGQAVTIIMCPYSSGSHWNLHALLFYWFFCCIKPWHDAVVPIFIYFITIANDDIPQLRRAGCVALVSSCWFHWPSAHCGPVPLRLLLFTVIVVLIFIAPLFLNTFLLIEIVSMFLAI